MTSRMRRFLRRPSTVIGLLLVSLFVFLAVFAPVLQPPLNPEDPWPFLSVGSNFQREPLPPGPEWPLGTTPQIKSQPLFGIAPDQDAADQWDVLYTLVWGSRSALRFGLVVTLSTAAIGIVIGLVAGYVGGRFGNLVMRGTDAFLAFPAIAAVWFIQRTLYSSIYNLWNDPMTLTGWEGFLYRQRIDPIMLALILFSWMPYARLMAVQTGLVKQSEYVWAAQSMGATDGRIIVRHILPNVISPAVVLMARDVGGMVLLASAFIFIGFGGNVAWGTMLVTSRDYVIGLGGNPFQYWWTFVPISLALILFGMGWNLLGDGLNAYLNPHGR